MDPFGNPRLVCLERLQLLCINQVLRSIARLEEDKNSSHDLGLPKYFTN